jgi:hypothetical protein
MLNFIYGGVFQYVPVYRTTPLDPDQIFTDCVERLQTPVG